MGQVYAWGENFSGEANVPEGLDAVDIAAGQYLSAALLSDRSTIVVWGFDRDDRVANHPPLSDVQSIKVSYGHGLALHGDGTVTAWGLDNEGQATVPPGLSGVIEISADGNNSLALKSDGTVVAWGSNNEGQRDVPPGLDDAVAISAGNQYSLALRSDGTTILWGDDYSWSENPDGINPKSTNIAAISTALNFTVATRDDGTVEVRHQFRDITDVPPGTENVLKAEGGDNDFVIAIKNDGTLIGWGENGLGESTPPPEAVDIGKVTCGTGHSLALTLIAEGIPSLRLLQRDDDNDLGHPRIARQQVTSEQKSIRRGPGTYF